jgi:hypothetical protein
MELLVAEETVGYGTCLEVDSTSPRYLNLVPLMHQIPAAVLVLLAGCCTSYGRVATVGRSSVAGSPDVPGLLGVVTDAVTQMGLVARTHGTFDGRLTIYSVRSGSNAVGVYLDHQTLRLKLSWERGSRSDFATQLQNAIERQFVAKYHADLQFEDVPCGWVGP